MLISFLSAFAIYFIIWWLVLFTILPWGVQSAHEAGVEVEPGHESAAPLNPNLRRKLVITTLVAAVVYGFYYWLVNMSGLSLDDIPWLPTPRV